ncbi:MAG: lytic transglycosylase domain-containing protein [Pseudomonadales bacterium]|nr:lytic transglycosylase domain-containing protein [Pseudomonadales bacterium]
MIRHAPLCVVTLFALWCPLLHAAAANSYQSCFQAASQLHKVPVDLLMAVATTESALNPDARSTANAHGIMQIQWPGTARHLGVRRVSELYNPCLNIELGARYLRELLDASGGDVQRALAAYNYGPTRINASTTLPEGAIRYASTVAGHQKRIERSTGAQKAALITNASTKAGVAFDSKMRAESFARVLNGRITGAEFNTRADRSGRHVVAMTVAASGLTSADLVVLTSLGWNQLGSGR